MSRLRAAIYFLGTTRGLRLALTAQVLAGTSLAIAWNQVTWSILWVICGLAGLALLSEERD